MRNLFSWPWGASQDRMVRRPAPHHELVQAAAAAIAATRGRPELGRDVDLANAALMILQARGFDAPRGLAIMAVHEAFERRRSPVTRRHE